MAKAPPNSNSITSITEIRDQALALIDSIRDVRRQENAMYVDSDSPARETIVRQLDQANVAARTAFEALDNALNSL
jgi:hypothetical protein